MLIYNSIFATGISVFSTSGSLLKISAEIGGLVITNTARTLYIQWLKANVPFRSVPLFTFASYQK